MADVVKREGIPEASRLYPARKPAPVPPPDTPPAGVPEVAAVRTRPELSAKGQEPIDVEWLDLVREMGWSPEEAKKQWSMREARKGQAPIDVPTLDARRRNAASAALEAHGYKTEEE